MSRRRESSADLAGRIGGLVEDLQQRAAAETRAETRAALAGLSEDQIRDCGVSIPEDDAAAAAWWEGWRAAVRLGAEIEL